MAIISVELNMHKSVSSTTDIDQSQQQQIQTSNSDSPSTAMAEATILKAITLNRIDRFANMIIVFAPSIGTMPLIVWTLKLAGIVVIPDKYSDLIASFYFAILLSVIAIISTISTTIAEQWSSRKSRKVTSEVENSSTSSEDVNSSLVVMNEERIDIDSVDHRLGDHKEPSALVVATSSGSNHTTSSLRTSENVHDSQSTFAVAM